MGLDEQSTQPDWASLGAWMDAKQNAMKPKMTDVELARRVGITRQHLGAIKLGKSGTKKPVVIAIANALGADPNEACDIAGFKGIRPEEPDIHLARRLVRILRRAPVEKRAIIEAMLEKDAEQYVSLFQPLG